MKRVLVAVPDLLFGVSIANAVRLAGAEPLSIRHGEEAFAAVAEPPADRPDAVVVDLTAPIDPRALIQAAASTGIRVFAFGPHLETAAIQDARAAGADKVVANAALATALPAWLAEVLRTQG